MAATRRKRGRENEECVRESVLFIAEVDGAQVFNDPVAKQDTSDVSLGQRICDGATIGEVDNVGSSLVSARGVCTTIRGRA
jgi:hypothetical protein